jgi:diguanylate cyclase (GGDEF)-like protein
VGLAVASLAIAILGGTLYWALRGSAQLRLRVEAQARALATVQRQAAAAEKQAERAEAERQFLTRFLRDLSLLTSELHSGASDRRIPELVLAFVTRLLEPGQALVAVRRRGTGDDPYSADRLTVVAVAPRSSAVALGTEIVIGRGEIGFAAQVQRVMDRHAFDLEPPEHRSRIDAIALPGFRPDIVAPLVVGERMVGALAVAALPSPPPEVKQVLRLIAQVAAAAVHQAARCTEMRLTASIDGLTGIFNKACLTRRLSESVQVARDAGGVFSVLLFDIDNFKHFNDRNGPQAGDRLLRSLAGLVQANIRRGTLFGRFGGEEFLLVLSGAAKDKALAAAYNLRRLIAEHPFECAEHQPLGCVSVSGGVATFPEDGLDSAALLRSAHEALYDAKWSGRNRILPAAPQYLASHAQEPVAVSEEA